MSFYVCLCVIEKKRKKEMEIKERVNGDKVKGQRDGMNFCEFFK